MIKTFLYFYNCCDIWLLCIGVMYGSKSVMSQTKLYLIFIIAFFCNLMCLHINLGASHPTFFFKHFGCFVSQFALKLQTFAGASLNTLEKKSSFFVKQECKPSNIDLMYQLKNGTKNVRSWRILGKRCNSNFNPIFHYNIEREGCLLHFEIIIDTKIYSHY